MQAGSKDAGNDVNALMTHTGELRVLKPEDIFP